MPPASSRFTAKLDMYRKVPSDLMEGSQQGNAISWLALLIIFLLLYKETSSYLSSELGTYMYLDRTSSTEQIRVQFNITMMDLRCDYIQMDVVSVLGDKQNATKYMKKFPMDANGVMKGYAQRNRGQTDLLLEHLYDKAVTKTIDELHEAGEAVVILDETTFEYALNENDLAFVDFYAGWCSHCKHLAPTWETLAKIMKDVAQTEDTNEDQEESDRLQVKSPAMIAKVDCVQHHNLCVEQKIAAYPTLRLFVNGDRYHGRNYRGERTIVDFLQYLALLEEEFELTGALKDTVNRHLDVSPEELHWTEALERSQIQTSKPNSNDHPGCQIVGNMVINKVPGNFHIYPYSQMHDLSPQLTNVSHEVHQLLFKPEHPEQNYQHESHILPANYRSTIQPMNGNVYVTQALHEAHHHYIKLVNSNTDSYQVLQNSQLSLYRHDIVPEAKFIIDISPIAIKYRPDYRHWYDYITSLLAIIGGTFTVVGLANGVLYRMVRFASRKPKKIHHVLRGPYK